MTLEADENPRPACEPNIAKKLNYEVWKTEGEAVEEALKKSTSPFKMEASLKSPSKMEAEFRTLFPEISPSECFVNSYACSYQTSVLVPGRLYISERHVCFHASVSGSDAHIVLGFSKVLDIQKPRMTKLMPNAIQIFTETDKYNFSSFTMWESTFEVLVACWKNFSSLQPSTSPLSLLSSHFLQAKTLSLKRFSEPFSRDPCNSLQIPPITASSSVSLCNFPPSCVLKSPSVDASKADLSEISEPNFMARIPSSSATDLKFDNFSTVVFSEVFPAPIEKLFDVLFSTGSRFQKLHNQHCKYENMVETEWAFPQKEAAWVTEIEETASIVSRRRLEKLVPLNSSIGPKSAVATEIQVVCCNSDAVKVVDCEVFVPSVPYGENFTTMCRYLLRMETSGSTRLSVSVKVSFKKSVFGLVKSLIQKHSMDSLKQVYLDQKRYLFQYLAEQNLSCTISTLASLQETPAEDSAKTSGKNSPMMRPEKCVEEDMKGESWREKMFSGGIFDSLGLLVKRVQICHNPSYFLMSFIVFVFAVHLLLCFRVFQLEKVIENHLLVQKSPDFLSSSCLSSASPSSLYETQPDFGALVGKLDSLRASYGEARESFLEALNRLREIDRKFQHLVVLPAGDAAES